MRVLCLSGRPASVCQSMSGLGWLQRLPSALCGVRLLFILGRQFEQPWIYGFFSSLLPPPPPFFSDALLTVSCEVELLPSVSTRFHLARALGVLRPLTFSKYISGLKSISHVWLGLSCAGRSLLTFLFF